MIHILTKNKFLFLILFSVWLTQTGMSCTKDLVYSKDYVTKPYVDHFKSGPETVGIALSKVLQSEGFSIAEGADNTKQIVTGWKPTEVDSHYFNLFNRRDYGTSDGAYYQVIANITPETGGSQVELTTKVKTIVGRMDSSGVVERQTFKKLADAIRPSTFEMTNVGIKTR